MFEKGQKLFARTITQFFVGSFERVEKMGETSFIVLSRGAWVADTGRFGDCLQTGRFNEVEVYPPGMNVYVSLAAVVDLVVWPHELPTASE